ncbi:DUF3995 domain-containing protein [Sciscionella sediminilitoris]|uniref:DUF3995 domain-containing protein n=1 Tax=Sciscionella sediminilitoris TaxID=1445613 RepID=UPI0018D0C898|nr:DUF3995 domain-containing protein [Sciscionella sp. SE31]
MTEQVRTGYSRGWPAIAAFVVALLFALVSLYWTAGGELGLDTVGGVIEQAVRTGDAGMTAVMVLVTVIKLVGAVFALALVQPWGRVFPRKLLLVLGWLGTAVLVLYGGFLTISEAVVAIGGAPGTETLAFRWHLYLWDPWFLVWGVALGLAMLRMHRR